MKTYKRILSLLSLGSIIISCVPNNRNYIYDEKFHYLINNDGSTSEESEEHKFIANTSIPIFFEAYSCEKCLYSYTKTPVYFNPQISLIGEYTVNDENYYSINDFLKAYESSEIKKNYSFYVPFESNSSMLVHDRYESYIHALKITENPYCKYDLPIIFERIVYIDAELSKEHGDTHISEYGHEPICFSGNLYSFSKKKSIDINNLVIDYITYRDTFLPKYNFVGRVENDIVFFGAFDTSLDFDLDFFKNYLENNLILLHK